MADDYNDYQYWLRRETWTLDEAARLFSTYYVTQVDPGDIPKEDILQQKYYSNLITLKHALSLGDLEIDQYENLPSESLTKGEEYSSDICYSGYRVDYKQLIEIAMVYKLDVPSEFFEHFLFFDDDYNGNFYRMPGEEVLQFFNWCSEQKDKLPYRPYDRYGSGTTMKD